MLCREPVYELSQAWDMPEGGRSHYISKFNQRVRALREARGWTQLQMATALGISEERYRKYENRSPLPHDLLERFALITGRSVHYIVTGRDDGHAGAQEVRNHPFAKPKSAASRK